MSDSSFSPIQRLWSSMASLLQAPPEFVSLTVRASSIGPSSPEPLLHTRTTLKGDTITFLSSQLASHPPEIQQSLIQMHQAIHQAALGIGIPATA